MLLEGKYLSELGTFATSTVSTVPSGNKVQPSSLLLSAFPFGLSTVHWSVFGSSAAVSELKALAIIHRLSGSTTLEASAMLLQPSGGASIDQLFFCGS